MPFPLTQPPSTSSGQALPISRFMQEIGEGVQKVSSPLMGED